MAEHQSTCVISGCSKSVENNGMCIDHQHIETCGHPGCDRTKKAFGYCNLHAQRLLRNGRLARTCQRCETEIPPEAGVGLRYCSDKCRDGKCAVIECARRILAFGYCKPHYRRFKSTGHPLRKCAGCEGYIPVSVNGRNRYCSDQCKGTCLAPGCSEVPEDMGYCGRHGGAVRRNGALPNLNFQCGICGKSVTRDHSGVHQKVNRKTCDECIVSKSRDHQKYRRKILASGNADCGICGGSINFELKWPDPGSLSIDHIVPITRGGTNREQNLQPAHVECNSKKRNWLAPPMDGVLTII